MKVTWCSIRQHVWQGKLLLQNWNTSLSSRGLILSLINRQLSLNDLGDVAQYSLPFLWYSYPLTIFLPPRTINDYNEDSNNENKTWIELSGIDYVKSLILVQFVSDLYGWRTKCTIRYGLLKSSGFQIQCEWPKIWNVSLWPDTSRRTACSLSRVTLHIQHRSKTVQILWRCHDTIVI